MVKSEQKLAFLIWNNKRRKVVHNGFPSIQNGYLCKTDFTREGSVEDASGTTFKADWMTSRYNEYCVVYLYINKTQILLQHTHNADKRNANKTINKPYK